MSTTQKLENHDGDVDAAFETSFDGVFEKVVGQDDGLPTDGEIAKSH